MEFEPEVGDRSDGGVFVVAVEIIGVARINGVMCLRRDMDKRHTDGLAPKKPARSAGCTMRLARAKPNPTNAMVHEETVMDYSIATMDPEIDTEPDPDEGQISRDELGSCPAPRHWCGAGTSPVGDLG